MPKFHNLHSLIFTAILLVVSVFAGLVYGQTTVSAPTTAPTSLDYVFGYAVDLEVGTSNDLSSICTGNAATFYVFEFTIEFTPNSFGGSVTEFETYVQELGQWVDAASFSQSGYTVTGSFSITSDTLTSITLTLTGINHSGSGYSDPTHVVIKLPDGTVLLDESVGSHTWDGSRSGYFEYVNHTDVTINYTSTTTKTIYNCSVASTAASIGQGPSAGSVSVGYSLGLAGLVNDYQFTSQATADSAVVVVPVQTETFTITETETSTTTYTYTDTYTSVITTTYTATGPGGTRVVTEVQTITLTGEGGGLNLRSLLVPLGLVAVAILFMLMRR
ncbi:hypothetical protein [Aeropyrum globular virus 1]|uniref:hypothetical protein n=1 Tax=Aeropyrum globular virus 1 TaxID=1932713 RepID=UPI000C7E9CBE|nr:hypothetical protein C1186_gp27 [Aeropyrum globular virus 1]BBC20958.1 hypothetical protein [Aeropyrum globular virus 1]